MTQAADAGKQESGTEKRRATGPSTTCETTALTRFRVLLWCRSLTRTTYAASCVGKIGQICMISCRTVTMEQRHVSIATNYQGPSLQKRICCPHAPELSVSVSKALDCLHERVDCNGYSECERGRDESMHGRTSKQNDRKRIATSQSGLFYGARTSHSSQRYFQFTQNQTTYS